VIRDVSNNRRKVLQQIKDAAPNSHLQRTQTHAPYRKGTWRGRRCGWAAFLERG